MRNRDLHKYIRNTIAEAIFTHNDVVVFRPGVPLKKGAGIAHRYLRKVYDPTGMEFLLYADGEFLVAVDLELMGGMVGLVEVTTNPTLGQLARALAQDSATGMDRLYGPATKSWLQDIVGPQLSNPAAWSGMIERLEGME